MVSGQLKSNTLLLLAATIWGFAFVAQRVGMQFIGPFTFNAIRFALGGLVLLPLTLISHRPSSKPVGTPSLSDSGRRTGGPLWLRSLGGGGILAGIALFAGSSLQQIGIVYTTAGKAGFITGLYVVIVPILGLAWRQRTNRATWLGAFLAVAGLYLLSVQTGLRIDRGDLLVLISAFFWAGHVHIIGWLSPRHNPFRLACVQFWTCSLLSFVATLTVETYSVGAILDAAVPILYTGVMSVGVAYTLQVVAQRRAHPSHAAIILSLEAVFAALGGWFVLNESLSLRALCGCCLMLGGMIVSQLRWTSKQP
jgi:drug/metabolite transporter (DMT)-like permease